MSNDAEGTRPVSTGVPALRHSDFAMQTTRESALIKDLVTGWSVREVDHLNTPS